MILFLELATRQFLIEYDVRPGAMLLQYLAYPSEISAMLWQGYRSTLLTTVLVLGAATWWSFRYFRVDETGQQLTSIELNDDERHRDALASVLVPAWTSGEG